MSVTDMSNIQGPVGVARAIVTVDISSDDYEDDRGFLVQVAAGAGALTVVPFDGLAVDEEEHGFANLAEGDRLERAGQPLLCRAVRSAGATVTSIYAVYL